MVKEGMFTAGFSADWHIGVSHEEEFPSKSRLMETMDYAIDQTDALILPGDLFVKYEITYINELMQVLKRYTVSGKPAYWGHGNRDFHSSNGNEISEYMIAELEKRIHGETGAICYENTLLLLNPQQTIALTGMNGYVGVTKEKEVKSLEGERRIALWNEACERLYLEPFSDLLQKAGENPNVLHLIIAMHYSPSKQTIVVPPYDQLRGMSPKIPEAIVTFAVHHPQTEIFIAHGHWHSSEKFYRGALQGTIPYVDILDVERSVDVRNVAAPVMMRESMEYPLVVQSFPQQY